MTQKEKAEELINKFIPHTKVFHEVLGWEEYIDSAKECALIAVDEILKVAFYSTDSTVKGVTKQCALIAVDEIINSEPRYPSNVDWDDCGATHQYYYEAQMEEALNYWKEVKQEIQNL